MGVHPVLVVRDERLRLRLESSVLGRAEFSTRVAARAAEAIELIPALEPSLVVLSNEPMDLDLIALCRELRAAAAGRRVAIVLVHEGIEPATEAAFRAAGGDRVLSAQSSDDELAHELALLLGLPVRSSPRLPLRVLAKLETGLDDNPKMMFANTIDISAAGLCLEAPQQLDLEARVRIQCVLPGAGRLAQTAVVKRVVNAEQLHYAIEFIEVSAEAREMLTSFFRKRGAT